MLVLEIIHSIMGTMNNNDNFELCDAAEIQELSRSASTNVAQGQQTSEVAVQSLLPCDGGRAAWMLLVYAFIFEALLWGM